MAKFGIALGSGPRGLGFESRHSDQKQRPPCWAVFVFRLFCGGIRKGGTSPQTGVKTCWGEHVFSPWENPLITGRIHTDVDSGQYSSHQALIGRKCKRIPTLRPKKSIEIERFRCFFLLFRQKTYNTKRIIYHSSTTFAQNNGNFTQTATQLFTIHLVSKSHLWYVI